MGGIGSGTLRVQRPMAQYYKEHYCPAGCIIRYQYGIKDRLLIERSNLNLEEVAIIERALPRLDMLVITHDEVRIVELKPNAQLRDVGQALQYVESLKRDVFLASYLNRPIKLILCSLTENANVRALVEGQGGEYIVIPATELPLPAPA